MIVPPRIRAHPSACAWLADADARGLSGASLSTYARSLEDYLLFLERRRGGRVPEHATTEDIATYAAHLAAKRPQAGRSSRRRRDAATLSPNTLITRLRCVRLYYRYLHEAGECAVIPVTPAVLRRAAVGQPRESAPPAARRLPWLPTDTEWRALLTELGRWPLRTQAMLRLAYDAALRREELVGLRLPDLDRGALRVAIRPHTTRGRLPRELAYSPTTAALVELYLATDRAHLGPIPGDALFVSAERGTRGQPLSALRWSKTVRALATATDLPLLTTQTFRSLRLAHLARAGMPPAALALCAGHGNPYRLGVYRALAERLARAQPPAGPGTDDRPRPPLDTGA